MKKNSFLDEKEKKEMEIWEDVDATAYRSDTENVAKLKSAAKDYIKKHETKMNIRISKEELEKIKERAEREGLRYQTFIKSILHKYMTGQLVEKRAEELS